MPKFNMVQAINLALKEEMLRDSSISFLAVRERVKEEVKRRKGYKVVLTKLVKILEV